MLPSEHDLREWDSETRTAAAAGLGGIGGTGGIVASVAG